jgi:TetR/AcrR family transcriptional regulator, transcriptional repressor for nem operon
MKLTKADRTKQFIIEKTAPVFNFRGYAGTSMSHLMEATGLTKGSIYGNFENKDEVALAAFDYNFGAVVLYIKNKMTARTSVIEQLLVYPETYRNFLNIPFLQAGCPVLNTSTEADDTHPQLKNRAANALKLWKSSIEKQIARGIENQEIKPDTNASEFAVILISLIEGAVMQAKVTGTTTALNATMNFLEGMILALKKT